MHEQFLVTYIDPEYAHLQQNAVRLSQELPTADKLPTPGCHAEAQTARQIYRYSPEQTARLLGISLNTTSAAQLRAAVQSVPSFLVEVAVAKQNQQLSRTARRAKISALHEQFIDLYAISLEQAQRIRKYARSTPDRSIDPIIKDRLQYAAKQQKQALELRQRHELTTYGSVALRICRRYRYNPPGKDRVAQETAAWTMIKYLQAIMDTADEKILTAFEQTYAITLQLAQKILRAYQQFLSDLKANRQALLQLTDG